jgi:hypothetical protein
MAENHDDVNLIDFNNEFDINVNDFQDYHTKRKTSPREIRDNLKYYRLNKDKKKPIYEREQIIIQMPNNIVRDNNNDKSCCGLAVYAWLCFISLCMCIIICFTLLKIYDKI